MRIQARFALLLSAAFAAGGAQAALAQDPVGESATGTTGAQQATSCPTPRLSGLPKSPKLTNSTVRFKLTNLTPGATYLITAGAGEVLGGVASEPTVKNSFLLPDQGTVDKKVVVSAVIHIDRCDNAPWKLEKKIKYNAVTAPAPAAPAAPAAPPKATTPAPAPAPAATPPAKPVKPVKPVTPAKPLKLPKPITERLPENGIPPSRLTWLTAIDGGARLDQKLTEPELARLERRSDKANSTNALFGLGIVGAVFALAALGGFAVFRHRDEVQFEKAMTEQLKHLEEGDPGMEFAEDPDISPMQPAEDPPFAEPAPEPELATEPVAAAAPVAAAPAVPPADLVKHRAEVEAELQRILTEAGLEAELEGILADARREAERHGVELDPDLMLAALCEDINGAAKLSDERRAALRHMFAGIIAEESRYVPAPREPVATQ